MGFCARFSDVFWREKQRWRLEISTVFSSYLFDLKTEPFPHALNITILVKEKGIIGGCGWFYVKPSTCIKSECVFELYWISTESTFVIPYSHVATFSDFFFFFGVA